MAEQRFQCTMCEDCVCSLVVNDEQETDSSKMLKPTVCPFTPDDQLCGWE